MRHQGFRPGIAGQNGAGMRVRVCLKEHPERGAQQHIKRPDWQCREQVDPEPASRFQRRLRGAITLHGVLVAGVFGEPVGQPDQQHHGGGFFAQGERPGGVTRCAVFPRCQRKFAGIAGLLEDLVQAAGQCIQYHPQADDAAEQQNHGLQHVGPDHRIDAADHGVQPDKEAAQHNGGGGGQVGDLLDQQRQQPQNHGQAHQLCHQKGHGAIHTNGRAVALFEKFVGAGHIAAPEKRQEHESGHQHGGQQGQVG